MKSIKIYGHFNKIIIFITKNKYKIEKTTITSKNEDTNKVFTKSKIY